MFYLYHFLSRHKHTSVSTGDVEEMLWSKSTAYLHTMTQHIKRYNTLILAHITPQTTPLFHVLGRGGVYRIVSASRHKQYTYPENRDEVCRKLMEYRHKNIDVVRKKRREQMRNWRAQNPIKYRIEKQVQRLRKNSVLGKKYQEVLRHVRNCKRVGKYDPLYARLAAEFRVNYGSTTVFEKEWVHLSDFALCKAALNKQYKNDQEKLRHVFQIDHIAAFTFLEALCEACQYLVNPVHEFISSTPNLQILHYRDNSSFKLRVIDVPLQKRVRSGRAGDVWRFKTSRVWTAQDIAQNLRFGIPLVASSLRLPVSTDDLIGCDVPQLCNQ